MLKKVNRLRKRYQYQYVYKAGKFVSEKAVAIHYVSSKTNNIKIGFAVTKKIGHAIKRNFIRRRLREITRNLLSNLKQNYNVIFIAKEAILETDFDELKKQIINLLKRADLLKNDEKNI